MRPVFSHGRLRLYLLKLLADGPRHGYELIRLLEDRFLGRYAPSAGTVYPRLRRMETDGLVTHVTAGGRKVYQITEAGRTELDARSDELAALEAVIETTVTGLAGGVGGPEGRYRERPSGDDPDRRTEDGCRTADGVADLERRSAQLLAEVRRLTGSGTAGTEAVRAALIVVEATIDQVRRLLR